MAQFGAVGCWALAVCGAFLGDFLTDLERAALGGGEGVVAPLLLPVFSGVSKARGGGQTVGTCAALSLSISVGVADHLS